MSDRIHVTMTLDLFVEDAAAMRQAAFERLRDAWSQDGDFPFESAADVPLDQAVHSLLADAIPAELPGCKRSQLEVEVKSQAGAGPETAAPEDDGSEDDSSGDDEASGDSTDDER